MESLDYSIGGFIKECVEVMRGLPHINYVPTNPPFQVTSWPMIAPFAGEGRLNTAQQITGELKGLHNPVIAMVMPLNDLAQAHEFMLPYIEQVPKALIDNLLTTNNRSSHAHTFGEITYSVGPIDWPTGHVMFGILFTINDVKVENTI